MAITEAQKWAIIGMHDSGKKIAEICATTKVERHQVSKILHENGKSPTTKGKPLKVTEEQKTKCIEMHKDGLKPVEIASKLLLGESTVRKICREYDGGSKETPIQGVQMPLPELSPRQRVIEGLRMILDALEEMEG